MSINCGSLREHQVEGKPLVYKGDINVAGVSGAMFLVPRAKHAENSPDWTVKVMQNGQWFEMGAAWEKDLKGQRGKSFFSITIDGPQLQQPLYVAGFPVDKKKGEFNITWSRPRGGRQAPEEFQPNQQNSDDIPY
ncbi:MAG: DUF736 family protein [Magnetococcales bacterium]|nr:DUF736 family protein [Magnetococcales bacterium]